MGQAGPEDIDYVPFVLGDGLQPPALGRNSCAAAGAMRRDRKAMVSAARMPSDQGGAVAEFDDGLAFRRRRLGRGGSKAATL